MSAMAFNHRLFLASLVISLLHHSLICNAFAPPSLFGQYRPSRTPIASTQLRSTNQSPDAPKTPEEDAALQWNLFTKYHAVDGEWWGSWMSYDYMGDVIDSTVAGSVYFDSFICAISPIFIILYIYIS